MRVYLDHGATTPLDKDVLESMIPYMTDKYGNANSQHFEGRQTAMAVEQSRQTIAKLLNCQTGEIYFTAGGTEADNWAITGTAFARRSRGNHIIVSAIEHHAILTTAKWLETQGFRVTYLPVNSLGIVEVNSLEEAMCEDTILVSVMQVNNETGMIQPIKELAEVAHKGGALFHTDCVQSAPYIKIDVKDLGVDMLTISAHKIYGPKGIGLLYLKNGIRIERLLHGGEQERARRGGTTNTPAIVGFANAFAATVENMDPNNAHLAEMRDSLLAKVASRIPYIRINTDAKYAIPSVANISFEFIEAEGILMLLDMDGICVSSGSACSSGTLDPSHVLLAMGVPIELAHGSIRFSFGKHNTMEDVDYVVDSLVKTVEKLRNLSPLFKVNQGEISNV